MSSAFIRLQIIQNHLQPTSILPCPTYGEEKSFSKELEVKVKEILARFENALQEMEKEGRIKKSEVSFLQREFSEAVNSAAKNDDQKIPENLQKMHGNVGDFIQKFWKESIGIAFSKKPVHFSGKYWKKNFDLITDKIDQRNALATIFEQTKTALRYGYILESKKEIILDRKKQDRMQRETKVFASFEKDFPKKYESTLMQVWNEDTFDLVQRLQKEGYHPAALNMANKKRPGGGVVNGWIAQEESLCLRSDYHLSLDPAYNPFLASQFPDQRFLIPEFGTIYSPGVQVFRSSQDYSFHPPFSVDLIASAAYKVGVDAPIDPQEYEDKFREKIRAIYRTARETKHDSVVLGAYGCGVYKNDPKIISAYFKQVLTEEEFKGRFRLVAFAVLNDKNGKNNFETFSNTLHNVRIL